ncbi:MAG: gamma-glutamylcyclotransferase [Methanobacteriota archaeon]|nr:MAG: gamma-glutamylcyclotransferase [Euryarchaeota archaeon]
MAHDVFAYGDFTKESVLRRVLGRVPRKSPAKLRGYRRFLDDVLGHYNLVHDDDGIVEGELLLDVSDDDLLAMDRYDTEKYRRRVVTVETAAGASEAWVYFGKA